MKGSEGFGGVEDGPDDLGHSWDVDFDELVRDLLGL